MIIVLIDGKIKIGFFDEELELFVKSSNVVKVFCCDIGYFIVIK